VRCFIALPLPEGARDALAGAAAALAPRGPGLGWTKREGYHLTLAFLGEIDGPSLEAAAEALGAAAGFGDIAFGFAGLGGFPARPPWRVLYARLEDGGRSSLLYRRVNEALAAAARRAGLTPLNPEWPGGRPFAAHVTLARARAGRPAALGPAAGRELGVALGGAWTFDRCALYKSELRSSGAVYTELEAVELSRSGPLA
jgi:RNA 2',3'-cyclic 3'-phosphodiesterase